MNIKKQFDDKGFVYLKNILSKEEVDYYRSELSRLSGIDNDNFYEAKGNKSKKINGVINYKLFTDI